MCDCPLFHRKDCEEYVVPRLLSEDRCELLDEDYVRSLIIDLIEFPMGFGP